MSGPERTAAPLRGARRVLALVWVGGVVLLYLAVAELGVRVVP